MLRSALVIALLYGSFVMHTTVLPQLGLGAWTPQLVVWAVIVITGMLDPRISLAAAAFCGLFVDGLSSGSAGPGVVAFCLTAYAAQHARGQGAARTAMGWSGVVALLVFLCLVASGGMRLVLTRQPTNTNHLLSSALAASLATAAFSWCLSLLVAARAPAAPAAARSSVSNRWRMLTD